MIQVLFENLAFIVLGMALGAGLVLHAVRDALSAYYEPVITATGRVVPFKFRKRSP